MADINDRLDRLQRREEFDRFGRPLRHAQDSMRVAPLVARPAGVDDRLGEVLDAVAAVVCRHSGMSVMVALADGQAGRPVIRVTERDGGVDTGVVVMGTVAPRPVEPTTRPEPVAHEAAPTEYGPYDGLSTPAAAPTRDSVPGSDPVFEPALRDGSPGRDGLREELDASTQDMPAPEPVPTPDGPPQDVREPLSTDDAPAGRDGRSYDGLSYDEEPSREAFDEGPYRDAGGSEAAFDGRHAASPEQPAGAGRSGSSWHDALWSPQSRDRFRQAEQERRAREEGPPAPGSPIPLADDTSQVVSRLAQLLRENPTLAANWSREAQE